MEIQENLYLLNKLGTKALKNIFVYDYYWRLLRNLFIKNTADLLKFGPGITIPDIVNKMIKSQIALPGKILNNGIASKSFMLLSYLNNYKLL